MKQIRRSLDRRAVQKSVEREENIRISECVFFWVWFWSKYRELPSPRCDHRNHRIREFIRPHYFEVSPVPQPAYIVMYYQKDKIWDWWRRGEFVDVPNNLTYCRVVTLCPIWLNRSATNIVLWPANGTILPPIISALEVFIREDQLGSIPTSDSSGLPRISFTWPVRSIFLFFLLLYFKDCGELYVRVVICPYKFFFFSKKKNY